MSRTAANRGETTPCTWTSDMALSLLQRLIWAKAPIARMVQQSRAGAARVKVLGGRGGRKE